MNYVKNKTKLTARRLSKDDLSESLHMILIRLGFEKDQPGYQVVIIRQQLTISDLAKNFVVMRSIRVLAIVLLFINGLSALAGGFGLIGDPSGKSLGWTTDMLKPSPFNNFLVPGLILFVGNGVLSILTAAMVIKRTVYYPFFILFQGAFLCSWIIIQMIMLRFYHPFHLVCGTMGVVLLICGYILKQATRREMTGLTET